MEERQNTLESAPTRRFLHKGPIDLRLICSFLQREYYP